MKLPLIALLLAACSIQAADDSDCNADYNKILLTATMHLLDDIQEEVKAGDTNYALALSDFIASLMDPNYAVHAPSSIKILQDCALIDHNNKVHQCTRNALKLLR